MISVRFMKPDDTIKMRTQCTFKVIKNKILFKDCETRLAVYELTLTSVTSQKIYTINYYEDGHAAEPYNYSKDIVSYERK